MISKMWLQTPKSRIPECNPSFQRRGRLARETFSGDGTRNIRRKWRNSKKFLSFVYGLKHKDLYANKLFLNSAKLFVTSENCSKTSYSKFAGNKISSQFRTHQRTPKRSVSGITNWPPKMDPQSTRYRRTIRDKRR